MTRVRSFSQLGLAACATLALCALGTSSALADAPALLPIQGYMSAPVGSVTPPAGTPYNGSYTLGLRIYQAPSGGSALHTEDQDVTFVDGYFTVYLGDTANNSNKTLDLDLFRQYSTLYLGIKVGADTEATPRLQLATGPFAAAATYSASCGDADTIAGQMPSAFATSGHTHAYSALTGVPATFAPAAHTHGAADIMCYADLTAEGYLDNNAGTDLVTRAQGDARYSDIAHAHAYNTLSGIPSTFAPAAHSHGAADIACYADLTAEGYLDNNASTDLVTTGMLNAAGGTLNNAGNPMDWSRLKGVPAGFADGTDNDTTYSQGTGIGISGTTVSVDSNIVARKDAAAGNQAFDTNTLFLDYANNRVGIATGAPAVPLDVAGNVRSSGYFMWPARQRYQFVSPAVYSKDDDSDPDFVNRSNGAYLYPGVGAGSTCAGLTVTAPVNLPHGATINSLECLVMDGSATYNYSFSMTLYARPYTSVTLTSVASISDGFMVRAAASAPSVVSDNTITSGWEVVDNGSRAYWLYGSFYTYDAAACAAVTSSTQRFYGCIVGYLTQQADN